MKEKENDLFNGVVQSWDTMPDVDAKIQKLEKELGGMK